jgi:hypothetical protein
MYYRLYQAKNEGEQWRNGVNIVLIVANDEHSKRVTGAPPGLDAEGTANTARHLGNQDL